MPPTSGNATTFPIAGSCTDHDSGVSISSERYLRQRRPGGRVLCDIEVHYPATMMCDDHQDNQDLESHGWHHQDIDRHQVSYMILQKRLPCRRRWLLGSHPVLIRGRFSHIDAEFANSPTIRGELQIDVSSEAGREYQAARIIGKDSGR